MTNFRIIFYQRHGGECPVMDFFKSLGNEDRMRLMHKLDDLELYGLHRANSPAHIVQDGLFDVALSLPKGNGLAHILGFFDGESFVLTHGYTAQMQRVSDSEIEAAKKYRADFFGRDADKTDAVYARKEGARATNGPQWRPELDAILVDAMQRSRASGGIENRNIEISKG